jgi:hypothetical protein
LNKSNKQTINEKNKFNEAEYKEKVLQELKVEL